MSFLIIHHYVITIFYHFFLGLTLRRLLIHLFLFITFVYLYLFHFLYMFAALTRPLACSDFNPLILFLFFFAGPQPPWFAR